MPRALVNRDRHGIVKLVADGIVSETVIVLGALCPGYHPGAAHP